MFGTDALSQTGAAPLLNRARRSQNHGRTDFIRTSSPDDAASCSGICRGVADSTSAQQARPVSNDPCDIGAPIYAAHRVGMAQPGVGLEKTSPARDGGARFRGAEYGGHQVDRRQLGRAACSARARDRLSTSRGQQDGRPSERTQTKSGMKRAMAWQRSAAVAGRGANAGITDGRALAGGGVVCAPGGSGVAQFTSS